MSTAGDVRKSPKRGSACGFEEHAAESCSGKSCCKPKVATSRDNRAGLCTSGDPSRASIKSAKPYDKYCAGTCCTSKTSTLVGDKKSDSVTILPDLEGHDTGIEHVVFSISGMTCTGCETKLNRTLATVTGVKNLKTSLILSRAEFDLDLSFSTVKDVMKHLERNTEFRCDLITSNGSSMDIIASDDLSMFINRAWPEGVTDIALVGKDKVRVAFDPEVVGARDLLEKHWAGISRLAPTRGDPALGAGRKHVRHVGYMTLVSAILTIPVLIMAWAPIPKREIPYGSASLALATLVQVVIAGPFYPKALKALVFSRVIEMDLLIVLSTSAAYIFSLVSFGHLVADNPLSTGQFFETSTLLVTLIMVGRYVAALARQKAVESISIQSLQTKNAILVDGPNSFEGREIDVRLMQYGDIFMVVPDTRIPTDGTIVSGSSEVNESMLTGESRPVEKDPKSRVIAGTVNGSGTLLVRVTRLPGDNTINAIAAMVDEAKLSKPKMQELADKVASYFVPVIVALTIATFVIWIAVGVAVQSKTGSEAAVQSITYAITVLIVSCPCAIGLAVPMMVVFASGIAAEQGVIFKSAGAIETAYKTSHVLFDKTGTLTKGKLGVVIECYLEDDESRLPLLLGLISNSKHPVSGAVSDHLRRKGVVATAIPGAKSLTGRGVECELPEQMLRGGNARWLDVSTHPLVQPVLMQGYTAFCFTIDGALCAVFGLEDSPRDDAPQVVTTLQRRGVAVHVVSGDDDGPVQSVASSLGIPESNVKSRCSPADKQSYIKGLLEDSPNGKEPVIMFCGDGTNDAVALAQATIGVHLNAGSDIAQSAADVVLMRPALSSLLTTIDMSKVSVRRIKFNFGWSFVYNTVSVLLAAGAFVEARIPPEFAGLGELVSVLPVIIAAALLRWIRV
ncbi:copper-transporting ATPase [Aspergillus sp. HF37]|nr:copper-transporting ATPase [Aspergillus sp. HF37]